DHAAGPPPVAALDPDADVYRGGPLQGLSLAHPGTGLRPGPFPRAPLAAAPSRAACARRGGLHHRHALDHGSSVRRPFHACPPRPDHSRRPGPAGAGRALGAVGAGPAPGRPGIPHGGRGGRGSGPAHAGAGRRCRLTRRPHPARLRMEPHYHPGGAIGDTVMQHVLAFLGRWLRISHVSSGFIAVLVGYTSSVAIVFQAASAAGADPVQLGSWMWALGIGMGVTCIGLSLAWRTPVLTAWSTPGAALLATSLGDIGMSQAIGVFLFSSALITLSGVTGWFQRIMDTMPRHLANAMLAGILLQFGLALFGAVREQAALVLLMFAAFI